MAAPPLEGTVSARKCPCCGHHEIGILDAQGEFTALSPGMHVVIENTAVPRNPETDTKMSTDL